jgi:hypothetical protein
LPGAPGLAIAPTSRDRGRPQAPLHVLEGGGLLCMPGPGWSWHGCVNTGNLGPVAHWRAHGKACAAYSTDHRGHGVSRSCQQAVRVWQHACSSNWAALTAWRTVIAATAACRAAAGPWSHCPQKAAHMRLLHAYTAGCTAVHASAEATSDAWPQAKPHAVVTA